MKPTLFFLFITTLFAEEAMKPPPATFASTETKTLMMIDPKDRAKDYLYAFDLLKKDKPSLKMMIRTPHATYNNISELVLSPQGTLIIIKNLSNQGSKIQIIPIEDMVEVNYSF